ncbi:BadF/BadG/BcrA/BcrD ATPase family protein [Leifsonia shinshuensis]|uniref:BadF/BadG/BcrA/BcrD ATPase family protein n=1 Tax=Leifsonia shinshuensis TaxID=150026 RepID=UPI002857F33C|nr:BadF/BadG/BcrA/BcrD ATPase family protein [Leifsonia shinshuensis]MDR6972188.1 N-acetylglucosamine kinase-like BadF-type ATPase [Leifsonia shinshuensis]
MLTTFPNPAAEPALAVAIDGGNSKTEVVVLERVRDGADVLVERMRAIGGGSGSGPQAVVAAVRDVLAERDIRPERVAWVSAAIAGLDFPGDETAHGSALAGLFPNAAIEVVGDAVAVLEAGGGAGDALAVVCGAGLNAVARGPLGVATVPALGWVSGDWGGGDELGREAVRAAARAEDGRGPETALLALVLAQTGAPDTVSLARSIRDGRVSMKQVGALATTVARAAAEGDPVATELMGRAAREAVLLAGVVTRGAWGTERRVPPDTPAALAGGLFADEGFRTSVSEGLRALGFDPRPLAFRPVDGLVRALRDRAADLPAAPDLPANTPGPLPTPTPTQPPERKDPR